MGLSSYEKYGSAAGRLKQAALSGRVPHAYILEGDHNTDKRGLAEAFAKALLCREKPGEGCGVCPTCRKIDDGNYEDLYLCAPEESGKSGTSSVKDAQIEQLQADLKVVPAAGDRNIAIIEGADRMTARAQTRILKTLEEPPAGTVILLLSENAEMLLPTIRSRCVTLRLWNPGGVTAAPGGLTAFAQEILERISQGAYYFDLKKAIDKKVRGRNDAYAFVDGVETALEGMLRGGGLFSPEQAARGAAYTEEARRGLQKNMVPKYAVMSLILRLEDLVEGRKQEDISG